MTTCNYEWAETYDVYTRNVHSHTLTHRCVEVLNHERLSRPMPHRCACEPIPQLSEGWEEE